MGKEVKTQTNLVRRGQVYYFRARIPEDLRESYGSSAEKTFSLRTKDKAEAIAKARIERLKLDQEFDHKRALLGASPVADLPDTEIERLTLIYYAKQLEDDEFIRAQGRLAGDMFDLYGKAVEKFANEDGQRVAGRSVLDGPDLEMECFLSQHGLKLARDTVLYRRVAHEFAKARKRAGDAALARQRGEVIETPRIDPALTRSAAVPREGDTLEALATYWKTQGEKRSRTEGEADSTIRRFRNVVGDLPASQIGKRHIVTFKDALLADGLAPATVRKALNLLGAIFETAVNNEKLSANPVRGVKVPAAAVSRKARVPHSLEDLEKIFRSEVFTQGKRPKAGRGEAAFWIPLIAIWSGARLDEIGQLDAVDIQDEGDAWYFNIIHDPSVGRYVKNGRSRRVPVHVELLRFGLLDYRDSVSASGSVRLFPLLSSGKGRQLTATWSQWFGRYLREVVGITESRKVFHSFRHGFKDACRVCGISQEHHDRITGHGSRSVGDNYGGEHYPLAPLAEAMGRLQYKGLDLSHLHRA